MLISIVKWNKYCNFAVTNYYNSFVFTALDSIFTNDNTPSLPLNNAHSEGFFF